VGKPWLCCANDIFETKTKDGSTAAKAPAPRTNPNTKEAKKLGCAEKLVEEIFLFFHPFFLSPPALGASTGSFDGELHSGSFDVSSDGKCLLS
jgi:hypothetical protein